MNNSTDSLASGSSLCQYRPTCCSKCFLYIPLKNSAKNTTLLRNAYFVSYAVIQLTAQGHFEGKHVGTPFPLLECLSAHCGRPNIGDMTARLRSDTCTVHRQSEAIRLNLHDWSQYQWSLGASQHAAIRCCCNGCHHRLADCCIA